MKLLKRLRNLWQLSKYKPGDFLYPTYSASSENFTLEQASKIEPGSVAIFQPKPIKKPGMAVIIKTREKDPIEELVEQINQ